MSSPSQISCSEINPHDIVLGEKIGRGGFASVLSARWFSLSVAVKLVFLSDEGRAKLKKEVALLSMLNSPAILRVFGVTYIDDMIGIVMELATSCLGVPSSLTKQNLTIAKEFCCAMKVLHSKSVIHGDLKPQNILLVNGQLRLADFGTSKIIADHTANSTSLTFTPKYAALEVFDNRITEASDIYSIGVILYELLTNKVAFEGLNTQFSLLGAKYQGKELPFDHEDPEILQNLVNQCMSNDPSSRPTIDHIIQTLTLLENYAEDLPTVNKPNTNEYCQNCQGQASRITELSRHIQELTQENQQLRSSNSSLEMENHQFKIEIESLREAKSVADELNRKLSSEISDQSFKLQQLSQDLEQKSHEILEKDELINQLVSDINNLKNSEIDQDSQQNMVGFPRNYNVQHLSADDSSSEDEGSNCGNFGQNWDVEPENYAIERIDDVYSPQQMFEKGLNFYREKLYQEAVFWFEKATDAGNAKAMTGLGFCYKNGLGVQKNHEQCVHLYKMAADAGDVQAMGNLGNCYRQGFGVDQDYQQACYWFQKAADAGHADSMNELGYCFGFGRGVEQDYSQAVYYYQKAADLGHKVAMYNLGNCYSKGKGVPKDIHQAIEWYEKAKNAGHPKAAERLKFCSLSCK
ncbi:hypothetical protein P9112_006073 [Eukaryota sp. TZLM1-RC]